jgi:hypothetical protein
MVEYAFLRALLVLAGVCLVFGAVSFAIHMGGCRWFAARQIAAVAFCTNVVIAFVWAADDPYDPVVLVPLLVAAVVV